MQYKVLDEADMPQAAQLWDYCFEKKDEPFFAYYFGQYCGRYNKVFGGFEEGRLRTMVHINPYTLQLRGRRCEVPYLVGIATAPEVRGQHLLRPLLREMLALLWQEGTSFVTLMPVNAGIYLPYGFAYCYYRHAYDLPLTALRPFAGSGLEVRRLELKELMHSSLEQRILRKTRLPNNILAPLYTAFASQCSGVPVRTDAEWLKLLTTLEQEGVRCAVVYRGGVPCGYLLYAITEGKFTAHELIAQDFAAKSRLLQYVSGHQSEAKSFSWLAEPWDKSYLHFTDQELSGRLQPFMMARCVNVTTALAQLDAAGVAASGSVVVRFSDGLIEENNCLLRLVLTPSGLLIGEAESEAELAMDAGTFAQLYFGTFSAAELWEAGCISGSAPQKLALLNAILPKQRTYNNEYF